MRDARTGVCVQTLTHGVRKGFSVRTRCHYPSPRRRAGVMAEGVGFEPTVSYKPTLDFESSALNQLSHPSTRAAN